MHLIQVSVMCEQRFHPHTPLMVSMATFPIGSSGLPQCNAIECEIHFTKQSLWHTEVLQ